jgi:hypothetical protein
VKSTLSGGVTLNATQVTPFRHYPNNESRFVRSIFHQEITTQNFKMVVMRSPNSL